MRYSYYTNILATVENETSGGYRLLFWEVKNNNVNLIFSSQLEGTGTTCLNLLFFESMVSNLQFAIIEINCVKYWEFATDGKVTLTNRIHIKNGITSSCISRLNNLLIFVDDMGRGIVINNKGQMIMNVSHPEESFNCIYVDDKFAYFGCQSGALCIYQLNTFQ
jgi:hypothetical protein